MHLVMSLESACLLRTIYWKSFLFFNYATQLLKTDFNSSSIFVVLDLYGIYGMKVVLSTLSFREIWFEVGSLHSESLYWKSDGISYFRSYQQVLCHARSPWHLLKLGSFQGRFPNETWPASIWANEGVREFVSLNGLRSQRIRARTLETILTSAISCHWVE